MSFGTGGSTLQVAKTISNNTSCIVVFVHVIGTPHEDLVENYLLDSLQVVSCLRFCVFCKGHLLHTINTIKVTLSFRVVVILLLHFTITTISFRL